VSCSAPQLAFDHPTPHQRSVAAFAFHPFQQPANMPLGLADLLRGLPLRISPFFAFFNATRAGRGPVALFRVTVTFETRTLRHVSQNQLKQS
jgi:hypothetical protein